MSNFSVVISVYFKENPIFLRQSLESVINQTLRPNEIVLVKDGPLKEELDSLIDEYEKNYSEIFKVIALPENKGLANALNIGIKNAKNSLIARMDSDDICFNDRFEKQLKALNELDLDIVGGQITEFGKDINEVISHRIVPCEHSEIVKLLKFRSPFSHPTILFKKEVFNDLNGYDSSIFPEDYDFFVRAYLKNYKFGNVPDEVLWFRLGENKSDAIKRRWGISYARNEFNLYRKFLNINFYNYFDFLKVILLKLPIRLLPFFMFKFIYFKMAR
ncbi:glycosyltransferase involved in cell wall biosynthesis [Flavobacterium nitrogenifigens]|uniref:Glycosyltransferase involved in cell wall biosynthesis n=2 Tax=Flavobacterium TaxID=237 RepID=A0A7W7N9P0_9FLAO|nr:MULTISPECIES: glycosyltransferase [Flavobacterium]MBB4803674.1 glycosyltransferase involved in cell wall biosynthesis [Flavobacterium nitrogenifigens]MBB6388521.1 glycosyltransferase involved in cell wall biosynthesis [Flavobacterium notoginsengisoli]